MPKERINIHLLHKLPTPYNDLLFRALYNSPEVELLVHHLWRSRSNRPWTVKLATSYPNRYLKPRFGIDWELLRMAWTEPNSLFVIGDWGHLPAISALVVRIIRGAPVAVWADTPQEQSYRPWYKRIPRRMFLSWLLPRVDVAFGTGQPAMRALATMGVPQQRLANLPCFVDLETPQLLRSDPAIQAKSKTLRKRVGCTDADVVFLMAGMCTPWKGQDIGIQAFASCSQNEEPRIGMLIAGDGPERPKLENLVNQNGLAAQISFLGWLNPDEMNVALAASDVVIQSSRRDAFPLVILEAMSWSKVVVASSICGSAQDRIVDGVNGFIFPSEDIEALAQIMSYLVRHEDTRQAVGRAARKTSEQWPVEIGVQTLAQTAQRVVSNRQVK